MCPENGPGLAADFRHGFQKARAPNFPKHRPQKVPETSPGSSLKWTRKRHQVTASWAWYAFGRDWRQCCFSGDVEGSIMPGARRKTQVPWKKTTYVASPSQSLDVTYPGLPDSAPTQSCCGFTFILDPFTCKQQCQPCQFCFFFYCGCIFGVVCMSTRVCPIRRPSTAVAAGLFCTLITIFHPLSNTGLSVSAPTRSCCGSPGCKPTPPQSKWHHDESFCTKACSVTANHTHCVSRLVCIEAVLVQKHRWRRHQRWQIQQAAIIGSGDTR